MKNLLLLFVLLMPVWNVLQGQGCAVPSLSSQSEIDSFSVNHPGCTKITGGGLTISGADITNLDGLNALTQIDGNLTINFCPLLTNFNGLSNLKVVGTHNILLYNNDQLINVGGLKNVDFKDVNLVVFNNAVLPGFSGLEMVDTISQLHIILNPELTDLSGWEGLKIAKNIKIESNRGLSSFNGFQNLERIEDVIEISRDSLLTNLTGFQSLQFVRQFHIHDNPNLTFIGNFNSDAKFSEIKIINNVSLLGLGFDGVKNLSSLNIGKNNHLESLDGFKNLETTSDISIMDVNAITDMTDLSNLKSVTSGILLRSNNGLINLKGLEGLHKIQGNLSIDSNNSLINLEGLDSLTQAGTINIQNNTSLKSLTGVGQITKVHDLIVSSNDALEDIKMFIGLHEVPGFLMIQNNKSLTSLTGLDSLTQVHELGLAWNSSMKDLKGLEGITSVDQLSISSNDSLIDISGLKNLVTISESLGIYDNKQLETISGFVHLETIGNTIAVYNNPILSSCVVQAICNKLLSAPNNIHVFGNADGCNTLSDLELGCNGQPVIVTVLKDNNNDCLTDGTELAVPQAFVHLDGNMQRVFRPTNATGQAIFGFLDTGDFALSLPQFPNEHWAVCTDTIWITPTITPDTIKTTFLLTPLDQCPDLSVDLGLPAFFRGCLVETPIQVKVTNLGTLTAENVQIALVLPGEVFDLVATVPAVTAQHGDTLLFDVGNLPALEFTSVNLTVKTRCDTFLLDQSVCLEAFAGLSNACPTTPLSFSEIRLYSECLSDTTVRFTLKNVGNAPTQALHEYVIIEDEVILKKNWFELGPQASMTVDVDADGSTFRIEATQFEDGSKTATAIENCGGLTPGFITAYWIDEGVKDYDFDCRRVVLALDPNSKSAVPTGVGPEHLLARDRPITYTIDFQNTGTDTAFRVVLRDVLSPNLDINTFKPGLATHPYDWQIKNGNTLEVTFSPIALPDSNTNETASHGFFTFTIGQKPNLPDGTFIENSAEIVFDYNPPILTNTVFHTIGELLVSAQEPQPYSQLWQIMNNPMKSSATFRATDGIRGDKTFQLVDTGGRVLYSEVFNSQEFTFYRGNFGSGMYFFRIADSEGRVFSGKVVISE